MNVNHPADMFEWSHFGANYQDTYCQDGYLQDADRDEFLEEDPCPFCRPADYWDYEFDGTYVYPTCSKCEQILPNETLLTFHDGKGLTFSAKCPRCGEQPMLFRDHENVEDASLEPEPWVSQP